MRPYNIMNYIKVRIFNVLHQDNQTLGPVSPSYVTTNVFKQMCLNQLHQARSLQQL